MPAASLSEIEVAIFATLQALDATAGGPFVSVARYVGETPGQDKQLHAAALGTPGVMLAHADPLEEFEPVAAVAALRQHAFVGTSTWHVLVTHTDVTGHDAALTGQPPGLGVLALVDVVCARLAGLAIPGLYRNERLLPIDVRQAHIRRGQYIYVVRFKARRALDAAAIVDDSVPDGAIATGLNLHDPDPTRDAEDEAINPVVQFDVDLSE